MIDLERFQKCPDIVGDDVKDTELLRVMCSDAQQYISSFAWAQDVKNIYFGFGIGGVIAIFLAEFSEKISPLDDRLWVIVGDTPNAYIVLDNAPSPRAALTVYCDLMNEWAEAVLNSQPLDEVFPVQADATLANAEDLKRRTDFLLNEIVPTMA